MSHPIPLMGISLFRIAFTLSYLLKPYWLNNNLHLQLHLHIHLHVIFQKLSEILQFNIYSH